MEAFLILIILWILYFAIHSVFASKFIKDLFNRYFPALFKYYRIIYVVFASFLLLLIFIYQSTLPQMNFYKPNTLITFIGFALATVGLIIIKESFIHYDTKEFLGIKQLKDGPDEEGLIKRGILKYIRHPLYSGSMLLLCGYLIFAPNILNLITVTCMILYFVIGSRFEERRLINTFKDDYIKYMLDVPPFIPSLRSLIKFHKKAKKS
jgi:protein-S-isoprenylcysteine O-methyltransferase Ste14